MDTRYFNIKICHNLFTQSPYCWTFSFLFPLPLSLHLLCSLPLILFSSFHGQVFSDINTGYFQVSLAAAYTSCSHSCSGRLPYLPHLTDYSQTCLSSMALGYSALKTKQQTWPLSIPLIVTGNLYQSENSSMPKLWLLRLKISLLYYCL